LFSGGSETFRDKQDFFYHEVRSLHSKRQHERIAIAINRINLLESVSGRPISYILLLAQYSADLFNCRSFLPFDSHSILDFGGTPVICQVP
jgi:hypothetical protein